MKRFLYAFFAILISVLNSCGGGGGGVDNAIEDDSFTIGYNANGAESGTAPRVQTGTNGASLSISANTGRLAKNGYLFDGWNTASDGSGADYTPGAPYSGKNITLYAKWARIFNYHVINGGSPAPALDGAQRSPVLPSASITGLTPKGQTLSDIDIPESIDGYTVSDIGDNAFRNCNNIANVTIPDTVTNIGDNAFNGCSNMHDMTLLGTIPPAIGAGVFISCTMIINVPQTAVGTYQGTAGWSIYSTNIVYIGASTYSIVYDGNGADGGVVPLMQVSLTGGYPLEVYDNMGDLTRAGCTFSGWNTSPDGKGLNFAAGTKFPGPGRLTLYAKWTHPDYTVTFDGQGADTEASPSAIKVIAPANTIAELPAAQPKKNGYHFAGWYTYPGGTGDPFVVGSQVISDRTVYAKWIGNDCTIVYDGNNATSGSIPAEQEGLFNQSITLRSNTGNLFKIGYVFNGWNTRADGLGTDYAEGANYTVKGDATLYAKWNTIFEYKLSDNKVIITGLTDEWKKISSLNIPEEIYGKMVIAIGDSAFLNCSGLTSVTIPNSVTSIGSTAFMNCSGLTSVTIPNSVISIGPSAFFFSGLTSVTIGNSVTTIGANAFADCTGLTSITIPNSVTTIGDYAFMNCGELTGVTIGNSVTSIGSYAFKNCSELTSIRVERTTPPSIGDDVFRPFNILSKIYVPSSAVNTYKNANGWNFYADKIEGYSE